MGRFPLHIPALTTSRIRIRLVRREGLYSLALDEVEEPCLLNYSEGIHGIMSGSYALFKTGEASHSKCSHILVLTHGTPWGSIVLKIASKLIIGW